MMRLILVELKIYLKKPLIWALLLLHILVFVSFCIYNMSIEDHYLGVLQREYNANEGSISSELDIAKMKGSNDVEDYNKALMANAEVYLCSINDPDTKECYQSMIDLNQNMIQLVLNHGYAQSTKTLFEYERTIVLYEALIENDLNFIPDERMDLIHGFIQYNENLMYFMIILICILSGCFSTSEEMEEDSFKTMAMLPYSRTRFMLVKVSSLFLINMILIFIPILIIMVGLIFMKGIGNPLYPYVIYQEGVFMAISQIDIFLVFLVFDIILCFLMSIIGFLFSYLLQDSIKALVGSITVLFLPFMLGYMSPQYAPYLYTSYLNFKDVLNGDAYYQSGNDAIMPILGLGIMLVGIILMLMFIVLRYRKQDLL